MATTQSDVQFRIGFLATSEYLQLSAADKSDFKAELMAEIRSRVSTADLDDFGDGTHKIDVDSVTGHASDAVIEAKVDAILGSLKDPKGIGSKLTRDLMAEVRYWVWDNIRECVHEYSLNYDGTDWILSKTYGAVTVNVQLRCALTWATDVP